MTLELRHRLAGAAASLGGTGLVFFLVLGMNELERSNRYDDRPVTAAFDVAPPPPEPPAAAEPEPLPEPEPLEPPAPPPLADLASDNGSIDIPVPGFDDRELDRAAGGADADRDMVMTDDTVDRPPKAARQVAMAYPADAKRKGIEGHVILSILIDEEGRVRQARVLESTPPGVFDDAALSAVRQWEFEPAGYQGKNVRVWARQTFRFALD